MSINLRLGSSFGPYWIGSVIGRGGMGVVYLAVQLNLARKVALKVLAPQYAQQEEFRRRFLRESQTSGNLEHPNVVPVYDAGEIDGLLFIAMRYVRGLDLKNLIGHRGALESGQALHVLTEVSKGLSAAHRVGLVHRDIKPANVLLAYDGPDIDAVYLTDFGLTKYAESSSQITKTGFFLGTYHYASPEQFKGAFVDHRSDIYSLGCVAFECLTGRAPFVRGTDAAIMYAHLMETVPAASSIVPELPPAIDAVIERSMSKNADERYDSCGEFVTELRSALVRPSGETFRSLVAPAPADTAEPADVPPAETIVPPGSLPAPHNSTD
jgi:serine/threonine protein kinase